MEAREAVCAEFKHVCVPARGGEALHFVSAHFCYCFYYISLTEQENASTHTLVMYKRVARVSVCVCVYPSIL